jgi:alkaline phosphatase D
MLWTRVPADTDGPHDVEWTVARDEALRDVVRRGTASSDPDADHTVHVDVDELEPGTTYHYRFEALGEASPVARTRTLPGPGADHLRFAVASCASFNAGWFNAYARIAERRDLAFLLHLGKVSTYVSTSASATSSRTSRATSTSPTCRKPALDRSSALPGRPGTVDG